MFCGAFYCFWSLILNPLIFSRGLLVRSWANNISICEQHYLWIYIICFYFFLVIRLSPRIGRNTRGLI